MFKLGMSFNNNLNLLGFIAYGGVIVCTVALLIVNFIK